VFFLNEACDAKLTPTTAVHEGLHQRPFFHRVRHATCTAPLRNFRMRPLAREVTG